MGADIEQRPLFGSPFHSTEAFGQKRLALSSILPHVGIDDRFARAANGLVIGHRHDGNAALGVTGLLGSGVLLAGDNRLAAPVVQSRHIDDVRAGALGGASASGVRDRDGHAAAGGTRCGQRLARSSAGQGAPVALGGKRFGEDVQRRRAHAMQGREADGRRRRPYR